VHKKCSQTMGMLAIMAATEVRSNYSSVVLLMDAFVVIIFDSSSFSEFIVNEIVVT
jgi:hypothetical protein